MLELHNELEELKRKRIEEMDALKAKKHTIETKDRRQRDNFAKLVLLKNKVLCITEILIELLPTLLFIMLERHIIFLTLRDQAPHMTPGWPSAA
ncbi:hypothetical protein VNO80_16214 [Phaseolus coccineus]|uniref:Uncharacterized protein n=1 Tax=Phaseolus coccineus TaxID=3886 RepID=A0AAN9MQH5_PHACN